MLKESIHEYQGYHKRLRGCFLTHGVDVKLKMSLHTETGNNTGLSHWLIM